MSDVSRHYFLFTLLLFAGVGPAAADDPAVCGGKPDSVRIVEALDGTSLRLSDGRVVRLSNLIAPLPIDGDADALARAKKLLAVSVNGKNATAFLVSDSADRYGRISATAVLIDGKQWLEADLLARGIARVFPAGDHRCTQVLLKFESMARAESLEFWDAPRFQIHDADAVEALLAAEGRFVVVEGIVRRVGEARGRLYLDFGRRFTEDFTIIVPDRLRKSLTVLGSDPKSWRGRRIRVRGVLFSWGGPAIELNVAQAIELLDRELPKTE